MERDEIQLFNVARSIDRRRFQYLISINRSEDASAHLCSRYAHALFPLVNCRQTLLNSKYYAVKRRRGEYIGRKERIINSPSWRKEASKARWTKRTETVLTGARNCVQGEQQTKNYVIRVTFLWCTNDFNAKQEITFFAFFPLANLAIVPFQGFIEDRSTWTIRRNWNTSLNFYFLKIEDGRKKWGVNVKRYKNNFCKNLYTI